VKDQGSTLPAKMRPAWQTFACRSTRGAVVVVDENEPVKISSPSSLSFSDPHDAVESKSSGQPALREREDTRRGTGLRTYLLRRDRFHGSQSV